MPRLRYVSTYGGGEQDGREFDVVARDAESIPDEAKSYGTDIPGCPKYLLYPLDAERQERKIIQYEYGALQNADERRILASNGLFGNRAHGRLSDMGRRVFILRYETGAGRCGRLRLLVLSGNGDMPRRL